MTFVKRDTRVIGNQNGYFDNHYAGMSRKYLAPSTSAVPTLDTTNIQLWLESDYGVTLNGATVSQWLDRSSNAIAFTQGTSASQPYFSSSNVGFNGMPAIYFDGSNDYLRKVAPSGLPQNMNCFTIYCVMSGILDPSGQTGGSWNGAWFQIDNSNKAGALWFNNFGNLTQMQGSMVNTPWPSLKYDAVYATITQSNDARKFYWVFENTRTTTNPISAAYINNSASTNYAANTYVQGAFLYASGNFALGSWETGAGGYLRGAFGAFLMYSGSHTQAQRDAVHAYLKYKYGGD